MRVCGCECVCACMCESWLGCCHIKAQWLCLHITTNQHVPDNLPPVLKENEKSVLQLR